MVAVAELEKGDESMSSDLQRLERALFFSASFFSFFSSAKWPVLAWRLMRPHLAPDDSSMVTHSEKRNLLRLIGSRWTLDSHKLMASRSHSPQLLIDLRLRLRLLLLLLLFRSLPSRAPF